MLNKSLRKDNIYMEMSLQEDAAHAKADYTPLETASCQTALLITGYILDSKLVSHTKPAFSTL